MSRSRASSDENRLPITSLGGRDEQRLADGATALRHDRVEFHVAGHGEHECAGGVQVPAGEQAGLPGLRRRARQTPDHGRARKGSVETAYAVLDVEAEGVGQHQEARLGLGFEPDQPPPGLPGRAQGRQGSLLEVHGMQVDVGEQACEQTDGGTVLDLPSAGNDSGCGAADQQAVSQPRAQQPGTRGKLGRIVPAAESEHEVRLHAREIVPEPCDQLGDRWPEIALLGDRAGPPHRLHVPQCVMRSGPLPRGG
jgi:hypothetical protein